MAMQANNQGGIEAAFPSLSGSLFGIVSQTSVRNCRQDVKLSACLIVSEWGFACVDNDRSLFCHSCASGHRGQPSFVQDGGSGKPPVPASSNATSTALFGCTDFF